MTALVMEVVLVKATEPGGHDSAWLTVAGATRRGAVHVVHDLPHLAVESLFRIDDGLWAELAAGAHAAASHATTARQPKRQKQGRIVSGAATGAQTGDWLTQGHRQAKAITNCVTNRWGDGPDTPAGVRDRAARQNDRAPRDLVGKIDDQTIALAIRAVRDLEHRWLAVSPGGTLRLCWPVPRDFFTEPGAGDHAGR
jgi:hypothetical protein